MKQIVELHGGTVSATSPGEGRGSTLIVSLPAAVPTMVPRTTSSGALPIHERRGDLGGVRILCVDDDADARALCKHVLANCGALVLLAASAEEALELIRCDPPHAIVSDIAMPHTDGYQLIRQVRRLAPDRGGSIPALALTAFARSDDERRAFQAGFQSHISKPFEPQKLVAVVTGLIRGPSGMA